MGRTPSPGPPPSRSSSASRPGSAGSPSSPAPLTSSPRSCGPRRTSATRPTSAPTSWPPILAPIRAGVPPSEFDLHYTVTCPDGTMRVAVIRASPMDVDPDAHDGDPPERRRLRRRGHRRHRPAAVRAGAERPGRPLPPPHRGLPRRGHRPPGRPARLRQPGRRQAARRQVDVGSLRTAGHRLRPPERHQRDDRPAGPADRARPVLRARRSPGRGLRRNLHGDGAHLHPHDLGRKARLPGDHPRRLRAPGGGGRSPLPGQPGRPRVRRHHRYRRRGPDRELERGRRPHLRVGRGRGGRYLHRHRGVGQPHRQRRHPASAASTATAARTGPPSTSWCRSTP